MIMLGGKCFPVSSIHWGNALLQGFVALNKVENGFVKMVVVLGVKIDCDTNRQFRGLFAIFLARNLNNLVTSMVLAQGFRQKL